MPFSLANVANEVYLRIDQGDDPSVPKLKKGGVYELGKAFFDVITQAVSAGEDVQIPQFGKFYPHEQSARNARNPKTGETIAVEAKTVPKFRPSSTFRNNVIEANAPKKKSGKKKAGKKKKSGKKS